MRLIALLTLPRNRMKLGTLLILSAALIVGSPSSVSAGPALRPPANIHGSPLFRKFVEANLDFVWNVDPDDYKQTIRYVTFIEENPRRDQNWSYIVGDNGICKVELNLVGIDLMHDPLFQVGGDLVHEGSLCRDYFMGNTDDVRADEIHALQVHKQFFIRSGAPQYLIDYMNDLIARGAPYLK